MPLAILTGGKECSLFVLMSIWREGVTVDDEKDPLDRAVDAAIEACEGDPRAALRALIIAGVYLQEELDQAHAAASWGYRRKAS